jgi:hypothetical protein
MIISKTLNGCGTIGGKSVQIISNTETKIVVAVDGKLKEINTVGKTPKEIGEEIRKLTK